MRRSRLRKVGSYGFGLLILAGVIGALLHAATESARATEASQQLAEVTEQRDSARTERDVLRTEQAGLLSDDQKRDAEFDERQAQLENEDQTAQSQDASADAPFRGDGLYRVGRDVRPGIYSSRPKGTSCTWERMRGNDKRIIATGRETGPFRVSVADDDFALRLSGCAASAG